MKYIMLTVKPENDEYDLPIIFPDKLVHKDVAQAVQHMLVMKYGGHPSSVKSAGFIHLGPTEVYGDSETLMKKSEDIDSLTITTYNYTHGRAREMDEQSLEDIKNMIKAALESKDGQLS